MATTGTDTPPQPRVGLQCSECDRSDFLTPHALAVHMARTHKVQGASKGPRAGKPGRPKTTPPKRFDPPVEELVLPPAAGGSLVVRRETPSGPELRLLVDVTPAVLEVLEWLGVRTMPIDLAPLEAR